MITLKLQGDIWMAVSSGQSAREVIELFGTATLPTGFTAGCSPDEVLTEIKRLNPDEKVTVDLVSWLENQPRTEVSENLFEAL